MLSFGESVYECNFDQCVDVLISFNFIYSSQCSQSDLEMGKFLLEEKSVCFCAFLIVLEKIMSDVASYTGLRHSNEMLVCSGEPKLLLGSIFAPANIYVIMLTAPVYPDRTFSNSSAA